MKRDKTLMIFFISIILFNVFFVIILTCYSDIIVIPNPFFKRITKEYWFWYLDVRPEVNNEGFVIGVSEILKQLFSLTFLLEFMYIISNKKYISIIERKNIAIVLIIGFAIYCFSYFFIKYKVEHYRLFMTLIWTEILSVILLNLILRMKKESD